MRRLLLLGAAIAAPAVAQDRVVTVRDPARLVAMGERTERQGDLLAATVFYERALELAPRQPQALRAAAANAGKRGEAGVAARYYAAWATAEPRNPEALIGLGSGLILERKPSEALAVLQRAADLGGDKALIAAQRGIALDLEGDMKLAQTAYAEALEAAPTDAVTTQRMALSLALGGDNGAAMTLLQRFGAEPEAAEVRRTLAMVHALGGRLDDAAEVCASVMPLDEARKMQGFYAQLPRLGPRDRALAVHFGMLPTAGAALPSAPAQVTRSILPPPAPAVATITPNATAATLQPLSAEVLKARPRLWVQLVSMSDAGRLPGEWRRIRAAAGDTVDGQIAYVQRAGTVNRLLIGPFGGEWSAKQMMTKLKAKRVPSALNRTPKGADVAPLS